jgi:hypothetical protein
MTSLPLADYEALSRKASRLLGPEQLSALPPSQRALLAFHLNELLETRGALAAVSLDDVRMIFERVAGFPPVSRQAGPSDDSF